MLGLFNTLNLGARALQAEELGVEISGQNLANSSNPAYARQRVNLQASQPFSTSIGMQGTGVEAGSIEQIRNAFLDGQIRDESSVGGYWNSQQSALEDAQTQLGEFLNLNATGNTGS